MFETDVEIVRIHVIAGCALFVVGMDAGYTPPGTLRDIPRPPCNLPPFVRLVIRKGGGGGSDEVTVPPLEGGNGTANLYHSITG